MLQWGLNSYQIDRLNELRNDPTLKEFPYKKSLNVSWKEGIPANIMLVVMDYYLVPLALFLGGTAKDIGFLVAIPQLLGSLSQLIASFVVRKCGSRLLFIIIGSLVQVACLVPMALLAIVPVEGKIQWLILLAAIFRIFTSLIGTVWGSLMSEYLPPEWRGRYMGWRSQIVGIAGVAGIAVAGLWLSWMTESHLQIGFFGLFIAIAVCRLLSAYLFTQMSDIRHEEKPENHFTFLDFIKQFRESNFVKFALYVSGITFATQLAAPYFSIYMLKDLNLGYANYMVIHMAAVVSMLISFPVWGKHADHVGNASILKTTSFLIPIIPLLWIVSGNVYYLIAVELVAGFIWGGFNIASANFVFDAVTPGKRVRCLGYLNLFNGAAVCLGAVVGGFLLDYLPPLFGKPLITLFLISGLLRFAAHFLLSGGFREVRHTGQTASSAGVFFSVLGIRTLAGLNREFNFFLFAKKPKIIE
jgi:MFS family permease